MNNVKVLLTGASGFIGHHLANALLAAGHQVVCTTRSPDQQARADNRFSYVAADFSSDFDPGLWVPRLQGIDIVINAVGIIRERGSQTFEAIHYRAPCALFTACARAGVGKVIQISALGADADASSRYHLSKKAADDFLARLPLASVIVQPSMVYGAGGTSARLFSTMASLPMIALPGSGEQAIQPVHVDDLVEAVLALLLQPAAHGARIPLVGAQPMSLRTFLTCLRQAMGLGKPHFVPVPMALMKCTAALGSRLPNSLLDAETLDMLNRGNTGDPAAIRRLLQREPRAPSQFIVKSEAAGLATQARLNWLLPLLRISIALVWIVTGIVSLGLYPVADSYALLARVGITGWLAPVMLYGAACMDLVFGIATLALRKRRYLWLAQAGVILFYTAIISWRLPEFWLHPYGPLLKNLPMLAAIWLLYEFEER